MSGAFVSPAMRCRKCAHQVDSARLGTRCPNDGTVMVLARDLDSRPDDAMLGRIVGGKFPVVGLLGEGGFGAVYRAVQEPVGRQVALKVIRGDDAVNAEIRARFFREAKVVAALSHPAVVTLHDYGEEPDGLIYIAFELVAGRPLSELIRAEAPFTPARAVGLVCQVLAALTEAHGLGLLHRDLKPDNLMVVQGSLGEEKMRLLDFGLSKRFSSDEKEGGKDSLATRQGIIMGTPRYMSPEQASGQSVDGRSDLYSMGILLYEMLGGRPPFVHVSPLDLLMAHIGEPVPPLPASLNLPAPLVAVLMRTLSKRPEQRHQTAAELARDLLATVAEPSGNFPAPNASSAAASALTAPGLRPARPDEETVEHHAITDPAPAVPPPTGVAAPLPGLTPPSEPDFGGGGTATLPSPPLAVVAPGHEPAPVARPGKSPVPLVLLGLGVGAAVGFVLYLIMGKGPSEPVAPLEPERQSVVVSASEPPTAPPTEPATAPPQPWERAIEYGKSGMNPEAGAQLIYLLRSSKDPWGVVERAKNDVRLAGALALPQVIEAIKLLPPKPKSK